VHPWNTGASASLIARPHLVAWLGSEPFDSNPSTCRRRRDSAIPISFMTSPQRVVDDQVHLDYLLRRKSITVGRRVVPTGLEQGRW